MGGQTNLKASGARAARRARRQRRAGATQTWRFRVVRDGRARLLCVGSPPPPASWAVVLTQPVGPAETRRTV
jgi:hypothetical protein